MTVICPWCASIVAGHVNNCPNCGFLCNDPSPRAPRRSVAARRGHPGRGVFLLFVLSSIFAFGFSLMLAAPPIAVPNIAAVAVTQVEAAPIDPLFQTLWLSRKSSIDKALHSHGNHRFAQLFVQRSPGSEVAVCGTVESNPAVAMQAGLRFVSMAGQPGGTVAEDQSPAFDTLWNRLCTPGQATW